MLRSCVLTAGAWGRGTQFAVFTSIALGLRQSWWQTDAMPQILRQTTLFCLPQPQAPVNELIMNRNFKTGASG
jgi:hypothetical protein